MYNRWWVRSCSTRVCALFSIVNTLTALRTTAFLARNCAYNQASGDVALSWACGIFASATRANSTFAIFVLQFAAGSIAPP